MFSKEQLYLGSMRQSRRFQFQMNTAMQLKEEGKIEEAKLFLKKQYVDLYDNWGVLILTPEMEKLLKERWEKIHLNHPDSVMVCSDSRCPKYLHNFYDESCFSDDALKLSSDG